MNASEAVWGSVSYPKTLLLKMKKGQKVRNRQMLQADKKAQKGTRQHSDQFLFIGFTSVTGP